MNDDYLASWAFSCSHSTEKEVQKNFSHEAHRWSIIRTFNAEGYIWNEKYLAIILRDKISGIPTIDGVKVLDDPFAPSSEPTTENIEQWQKYLRAKFSIKSQDFVTIIPIKEGNTIEDRWAKFDSREKQLWHKQLEINMTRQFYHLKGFDAMGDFLIPPAHLHLTNECQEFLKDNPSYDKNVFIMMKFDDSNSKLKEIDSVLRSALISCQLNPLRADDKVYPKDRDLWNNVCVYMICCKYGLAVIENNSRQEYNPNVSIEYGFMRAFGKSVLLLADKDFPKLPADVSGKLREPFDTNDVSNSINQAVNKWTKELV